MNGDLVFCGLVAFGFAVWVYIGWCERHIARHFRRNVLDLFPTKGWHNEYDGRGPMALDMPGGYYIRHIEAMTRKPPTDAEGEAFFAQFGSPLVEVNQPDSASIRHEGSTAGWKRAMSTERAALAGVPPNQK